ncbi:MAG: Gldg family protein [Alphaproteobacteria bacterium]|nr:Gldg family protein [Alphaproteobacteria bacterium]
MRKLWIVVKNELLRYFISPLAYVYLVSFLVLNAVATFYFGHFFERGQATLFYMFIYQPWLYLLFLTGISMRLWAEEFKSKTVVQIMTMPVSLQTLVWGKFIAALMFCLIALILTFPFVMTVNVLGEPDNGVIALSYFASFLLAAAMLAVSQTMSALSKNQVIALVLAVGANLVFFFCGLEFVLAFFRLFLPDYMVDAIASFSFLTHFNAIILGLIEWRDVLFFASIILLFNFTTALIVSFKTSGVAFWLKSTSKVYCLASWALLVVAFMGFNLLANNFARQSRLDVSEEKLFSLNQNTIDVLQTLEQPITIKLYFSNILEKRNPNFRILFDRVRMLLQTYKDASNGKLNYRIYHPKNLDNLEDRAIADGLQPIALIDANQNALFGLSIVDALDRKAAIAYLSTERIQFLEQDLTTLIYSLGRHKKTIGIISSLPVGGETLSENMIGQPYQILEKIEQLYNVRFIQNPDDLNDKPDLLWLIHPKNLSLEMTESIKQYAQKGGKLLILLDVSAEATRLYSASNFPLEGSNLNGLDEFFGFSFYHQYVVADLENSITVDATSNAKNNPAYTQDIIQFKLQDGSLNPYHPITKNLKSILMSSAGVLLPRQNAEISFMPLIQASADSALMPAKVVYDGLNPRQILSFYTRDDNLKVMAAYIRSTNQSKPFELIVVGDTDFIYDSFWATTQNVFSQKYVVPLFNNADFILNAFDFLLGDNALIQLRAKSAKNRAFKNVETLRKRGIFAYKIKEEEIFRAIDESKQKLQEIFAKRSFEERETFSADELKLIFNIRNELSALKQNLNTIREKTTADVERIALLVKFFNIFALPLLLSFIALIILLLKKRHSKQSRPKIYFDRAFYKLLIFALVLLLAGVLSVYLQSRSDIQKYEDKPVFPALSEKINDIKKIRLRKHDGELTFVLKDGLWVLEQRPDWAVYQERIRSFLSALMEAVFYEKKSDKAENLGRFGLLPIEAPQSSSTLVELLGQNDDVLESVEIGDYNLELGRGTSGAYIKFEDKFQVWLADINLVDLSLDWHAWTYSRLWDLRFGRIRALNALENPDILALYMKYFLNISLSQPLEILKNAKKIASFQIDAENDLKATLSFYQAQNKYFVQYAFENFSQNKHILLFENFAKGKYFEISSDDWEKIENVNKLVFEQKRPI